MIAGTIWTQLISTLKENPALSVYMKNVYEGQTFDLINVAMPCIMLEPTGNNEVEKDFNQTKNIYLNINLFAFSSANYTDSTKNIVGGQNYKGILDIENDIRACLQSSYDLGGTVIDVRLDPTQFDLIEQDKYPVRGMLIPLRILYRQTNNL